MNLVLPSVIRLCTHIVCSNSSIEIWTKEKGGNEIFTSVSFQEKRNETNFKRYLSLIKFLGKNAEYINI